MLPFVLQRHSTREGVHYDLMLDAGDGGRLPTWRLDALPSTDGQPLAARRLADHRRIYLTYEGPIGGDRGEVHIADAGSYECEHRSADRWVIRLCGEALAGRFELRRDAAGGPGSWRMVALPPG